MNIQSMLFDPAQVDVVRKMLAQFDVCAIDRKKYKKFSEFLLGICNNEAWHVYHDQVLENLGIHNPYFVFGAKGTGKTHFLEAICDDLLSRDKAVVFLDLASDEPQGSMEDALRCVILVLDNFHTITNDPGRINDTIELIRKFVLEGKQVIVGSVPLSEDLPEMIRDVVDTGLSVKLDKPSADVVTEYIRKHGQADAEEMIQLGIPKFDSFYELEYYLSNLGEGASMLVPLGLPGEEEFAQLDESVVTNDEISSGRFQEGPILESHSLDVSDKKNYIIPDIPVEFIEEKF
jgi:hypothetical protein